jgi:PAS domain S-box-containing protein
LYEGTLERAPVRESTNSLSHNLGLTLGTELKFSFFRTIKNRLLLLVFITILPALGIIMYTWLERSKHDIHEAQSDALKLIELLAYEHEQAVGSTRLLLMALSKTYDIQNLNIAESNRLLGALMRQNRLYGTLFVVDAQGTLISSGQLPFKPVNLASRKYFQDAVRSRDFSIGEYAICLAARRPVLHLAYPFVDGGGTLRVVVCASLDIARYARMFQKELPPGSVFSISDSKGVLLYRHPDKEETTPTPDDPGVMARMTSGAEKGVFIYAGADGEQRLNAFKRFHLNTNSSPYLFMRVSVPQDKAVAYGSYLLSVDLLLLGMVFIIAALAAWFLGNNIIVKRLDKLVNASVRLGQGDLTARTGLDYTSDELGRLAKTFDDMAESLGIMHTDREAVEYKLKSTALEWQTTFDSITDHVMILENNFKIVRGNKAFADFFDQPVDSLAGQNCYALMHGTDRPLDSCPVQKMYATGMHEETEYYCARQGKWLLISADPITDSSGKVIGAVHIVKNISDRKLSEKAITIEKQRFQTLVDNAPFGMLLTDKYGIAVTYLNPCFKKFFGYEMAELPDLKSWFEKAYPDPELRKGVISCWRLDVKDAIFGLLRQRVYPVICRDGSRREVNFTTVFFNSGEILLCADDVTERRTLEEQLVLARKMEAIGTLAGGIAHDFNNILMAILGYTSVILMDTEIGDPKYEKLKIIEEQVRNGAGLTQQLLGFARGGKYDIRTIDLNELISSSVEKFGRNKEGVRIHQKLDQGLWPVEADRMQIEQVFSNLFVNAWQAMPEGGDLYLETRNVILEGSLAAVALLKPGKYVCTAVTDTGVGMDEIVLQKVFEPFFTTKEMGGGAGLGLASAYGVVKHHSGTIQVASEKGKGTTFNVYLPASGKELVNDKPVEGPAVKGSEIILFVDDQDAVASVGEKMLQTLGYTVLVAKSGKEALDLYGNTHVNIDMVILDMVMPVMSGGETYRALKEINPRVKVILSSGFSIDGEAAKILESGCNGFIQKPFNITDLSKKIREVLG